MENIIWNSEREKCENCDGHPSVRMKTKNNKTIIIPQWVTTPFGGELCGTGCAMSWINKHQKKRLKKININDYLQNQSIILRDVITGCSLSLPHEPGRSGTLTIDKSLFYIFNGEIPIHSTIEWINDGEYVNIYG